MSVKVDVVLTPAEFPALAARDLSQTTCVVFDVLRATSSMLTALNNGAAEIVPVVEISEALAVKKERPEVRLAGERNGLKISKELTGSIDFDFGNSPRDFVREKVNGKAIAWTTTNGTRALRACARAEMVLLGGMVNLSAVTDILRQLRPRHLVIVCAGTFEEAAFEDLFAAGALIESLRDSIQAGAVSDAAQLVWRSYLQTGNDFVAVIEASLNARRLLANIDLAPDVPLCLERNSIQLNAALMDDGCVRPMRGFGSKLA